MGDAVLRVRKYMRKLSEDNLADLEKTYAGHAAWLQEQLNEISGPLALHLQTRLKRPAPATHSVEATEESATKKQKREEAECVVVKAEEEKPAQTESNENADSTTASAPAKSEEQVVQSAASATVKRKEMQVVTVKKVVKRVRKVLRPKAKPVKEAAAALDVDSLKVVELKAELKKRGLKTSGLKAVLAQRLTEAIEEENGDSDDSGVEEMEEVDEKYDEEIEEQVEVEVEVEHVVQTSTSTAEEAGNVPQLTKETEIVDKQLNFDDEADPENRNDVASSEDANEVNMEVDMAHGDDEAIEVVEDNVESEAPSAHEQNDEQNQELETVSEVQEDKMSDNAVAADVQAQNDKHDNDRAKTEDASAITDNAASEGHHESDEPKSYPIMDPDQAQRDSLTVVCGAYTSLDDDEIVRESTETFSQGCSQPFSPPLSARKARKPMSVVVEVTQESSESPVEEKCEQMVEKDDEDQPRCDEKSVELSIVPAVTEDEEEQQCAADVVTEVVDEEQQIGDVVNEDQDAEMACVDEVDDGDRDDIAKPVQSSSDVDVDMEQKTGMIENQPAQPGVQTMNDDTTAVAVEHTENPASVVVEEGYVKCASPVVVEVAESRSPVTLTRYLDDSMVCDSQADLPPTQATQHEDPESNDHAKPLEVESSTSNSERKSIKVAFAAEGDPHDRRSKDSSTLDKVSTPNTSSAKTSTELSLDLGVGLTTPSPVTVVNGTGASSPTEAESESAKKRKRHQEQVQREAQRLRMAAKQSAKKRIEEAKASSLFWAKREQMKLQLQASTPAPSSATAEISSVSQPSENIKQTASTSDVSAKFTGSSIGESQDMKKKASETGVNQHTEPTETNIKSEAPKAAADNDAAGVTSSQDAPSSQESNLKARTTAKGSLLPVTTGRSRQKRNDSISSNRSVASSQSSVTSTSSGGNSKPQAHSGVPATRKPVNLVSGLHSFTSLIDKEKENTSSATTSSGRSVPVVNALKLAEKSRLQEQKKTLDKQKRKEALMRRYEEQRKLDEEKKKKQLLLKERAEREAKIKQEKANDKKQRELELAKKRQQRLQEMRAGLEKRRAQQAAERETAKAATSSSTKSTHSTKPVPAPSAHKEPSKDKEVTTYEMSDNGESEEEDSVNSEDEGRSDKNIPKWAQRDTLERTLRAQFGPNAIDPTPSIFPDFVDSCDLEAIFETSDAKKKKRFARRTSSGNWLADRPTAREKAMYKREMGFDG